jgi:hypothetical protein
MWTQGCCHTGGRPLFCRYYGSEFINQSLYDYCRQGRITFTRSRAWKKHDNAHVEQKNGAVVRQLIGYDRFASQAAYAQLRRVYRLARLHVNFFQPVQKLVSKHRDGARVRRVYDRAQTPYRACATGVADRLSGEPASSSGRSTGLICGRALRGPLA